MLTSDITAKLSVYPRTTLINLRAMNEMNESVQELSTESGYLLIADMENSTQSKFVLTPGDAFHIIRRHNRIVIEQCQLATPRSGIILNALGDAVVAKFPLADTPQAALTSCMTAARAIITAFEQEATVRTSNGRTFALRTKILLQRYDAFTYARRESAAQLSEELVGADIDLAFRLAPVAWRLQVIVTEAFLRDLLALDGAPMFAENEPQKILDRAHLARHSGASGCGPLTGIAEEFQLGSLRYWLTDAREIARLKGIKTSARVYALSFESEKDLSARGEQQRLTIKVRQNHHAVILVSVSAGQDSNDSYIEHIIAQVRDATDGNRLDSEVTLLAAAKIYGEFDFFFRISCIDDGSLQRFFRAIRADSFGVREVEVRSTVADRFAITRNYADIFTQLCRGPHEIILAWFERPPDYDLFDRLKSIMRSAPTSAAKVHILEVGEVIHRTPIYAIFICDSLRDYAAFFAKHGLRPTSCRSHVGHIDQAGDAQLRYSLVDGLYLPRVLPAARPSAQ